MKIVCQQPHYLPWLGYFELFARADAFLFLDSVQWTRQGRQHRTKILARGQPRWLTVPVQGRGHREKTLKEMEVSDEPWAETQWRIIQQAYGHAPRFRDQVEPLLRPYFEKMKKEKFLLDICLEGLWLFWEPLGLKTEIHFASDFPGEEEKNERLIRLCRTLGASHYYSSLASTRYLDLSRFRAAGVQVEWQHFRSRFPGDILRNADLSILDWIAHHDWKVVQAAIAPRSGFPAMPPEPRAYTE